MRDLDLERDIIQPDMPMNLGIGGTGRDFSGAGNPIAAFMGIQIHLLGDHGAIGREEKQIVVKDDCERPG